MSALSEIIIELKKSKTYLRIISAAYLISLALVVYSSVYLLLKLVFLGWLIVLIISDCRGLYSSLKKIHFINNGWLLENAMGTKEHYTKAILLIHNPFFQLIEFVKEKKKIRIVLFIDQLNQDQLRLFHLKIIQNGL